jgi:hypothetical protein
MTTKELNEIRIRIGLLESQMDLHDRLREIPYSDVEEREGFTSLLETIAIIQKGYGKGHIRSETSTPSLDDRMSALESSMSWMMATMQSTEADVKTLIEHLITEN